jgi:DNA-binding CsgD family transcriptional regulator
MWLQIFQEARFRKEDLDVSKDSWSAYIYTSNYWRLVVFLEKAISLMYRQKKLASTDKQPNYMRENTKILKRAYIITIQSVTITKAQQITYRREKVLELSAKGLTQQEIAGELLVSQKTVSNDLTWLKNDAIEVVKQSREYIAFEYTKSLAVLDHIKKMAFEIADKTEEDRNKITALRLAAETEVSKARLLAEGPGVLAVADLQERLNKIENLQFQNHLQRQQQHQVTQW